MFDVTALGEVLIDFTDRGTDAESGMRLFEQNPGGAPANVAAAVCCLGGKSAFIGRVGADMHGEFLIQTLSSLGVDVSGVSIDPKHFTTLAFVSLSPSGERSFSFARKPGADTQLRCADIPDALLSQSRILHFGSLSMTDEPACSATRYAIERARNFHAIIAYDPNDRPLLWPSRAYARDTMRSVLPSVDVIKLSLEETALLTDTADPVLAAARLVQSGIQIIVITMGAAGAIVRIASDTDCRRVPAFPSPVVDTTGAGDAFWGGFLYCLSKCGKQPEQLSLDEAAAFVRYGNAVAACSVRHRGAIPSLPSAEDVAILLK